MHTKHIVQNHFSKTPFKYSFDTFSSSKDDSESENSITDFRSKRIKSDKSFLFNYFEIMNELISALNDKQTANMISHRENERLQILEFISINLNSDANSENYPPCLIIFGQPGMGKTKLLNEIAESLSNNQIENCFTPEMKNMYSNSSILVDKLMKKPFVAHFFNCMNYNSVIELLIDIYDKITKQNCPSSHRNPDYLYKQFYRDIESILQENNVLLMIDELEYFLQKDQKSFLNLINFLQIKKPGFVKFGISNTLNLISTAYGKKTMLNFEFLIFKPYTKEVLKEIIMERVINILDKYKVKLDSILPDVALDFLLKTVVNNRSSDIRALLSLTSGVIESKINNMKAIGLKADTPPNISIKEVVDFFIKNSVKKEYEIIKRLNLYSQVMLLAIYACIQDIIPSSSIVKVEKAFWKLSEEFCGDECTDYKALLEILKSYNLIKIDKAHKGTILSVISKQELGRILEDIETFKEYFHNK